MMKCSFVSSKTTLAAVPALEDLQLLAPAELLPLLLQLPPGRQQPRHLRGRVPQLQLVPLLCIVIVIIIIINIIIIIIFITNYYPPARPPPSWGPPRRCPPPCCSCWRSS